MKWHTIEVDDDVMEYLKKRAEPFKDTTPNSVLRRELLKGRQTTVMTSSISENQKNEPVDHFPAGMPVALQQILEVTRLSKRGTYSRNEATHIVSKRHGVAPQTVQDKYGRQLGLIAGEFDRLLAETGLNDLVTLLIKKFPRYGDIIKKYLQDNGGTTHETTK